MTTTIRALAKSDEAEWRRLWTGYLEFYETSVAEEVYHTTFSRLLGKIPKIITGCWRNKAVRLSA